MSIFSKLFGNKKTSTSNQPSTPTDISVRDTTLQSNRFVLSIHPDRQDYLWIGDGKLKNYIPTPSKMKILSVNGLSLSISFGDDEEPSLLFLSLPISNSAKPVERPPLK